MPTRRPIPAELMFMIEKRDGVERRAKDRRTGESKKETTPEMQTTKEDSSASRDVEIDRRKKKRPPQKR